MKDCIRYQERRYKYLLVEPYRVRLPEFQKESFDYGKYFSLHAGILVIRDGYAWDGPSGPTVDTKDFLRGSLVHDVLYQAMRLGLLPTGAKPIADDILRRLCREDGMSWIRAWWVWRAVRNFAGSACKPGSEPEIKEAP